MNTSIGKYLLFVVKLLITCLAVYFVLRQVIHHEYFNEAKQSLWIVVRDENGHRALIIAIVLLLVNWGVEAVKWRLLVAHVEEIGFVRSFRSVLSGVTVSFMTPNRMGEFAGRILHLDEGFRVRGAMAAFVGNTAQLLVTLQAGCIAMAWYADVLFELPQQWSWITTVMTVSLAVTALIFWFRVPLLTGFLERNALLRKYHQYIDIFASYRTSELVRVYGYSVFRYGIFCTQYYLLLRAVGVQMPFIQVFGYAALCFLAITLLPTFALTELGIRGAVSVAVFSGLGAAPSQQVLLASFWLYIINLAVPALAGALMMLFVRLKSSTGGQ